MYVPARYLEVRQSDTVLKRCNGSVLNNNDNRDKDGLAPQGFSASMAKTATTAGLTSSIGQTSIKVATLVKKDYTVLKRVCPSMSFKETTNNNLIETSKTE